MHVAPMAESEGKLGTPEDAGLRCRSCGGGPVTCQRWESECGGFVDWKYTCGAQGCGHTWWVDGPDA